MSSAAPPSRAEYAVSASIWLLGVVTAIVSYGAPDVHDPVGLVFVGLWATFHFALISVAVLERTVGSVAIAVATTTAIGALVLIPSRRRGIDRR